MSKIEYLLRVAPYENPNKSRFGASSQPYLTTKNITLEFDISKLNEQDMQLFLSMTSNSYRKGDTVFLETYELDEGTMPVKSGYGSGHYQRPMINSKALELDHEIGLDDAIQIIRMQKLAYDKLVMERDSLASVYKEMFDKIVDDNRIENERKRAVYEAAKEQREKEALERKASATTINWRDDNIAILNLYEQLFLVSELDIDHRWQSWIRQVVSIDKSKTVGAKCFVGDYIRDETIEIENQNAIYLVASETGSNKHRSVDYRIVILRDGKLELTNIKANNIDKGWALLIRDDVQKLLGELNINNDNEKAQSNYDVKQTADNDTAMKLCADLLNFQTYPAIDYDQFKARYDLLRIGISEDYTEIHYKMHYESAMELLELVLGLASSLAMNHSRQAQRLVQDLIEKKDSLRNNE